MAGPLMRITASSGSSWPAAGGSTGGESVDDRRTKLGRSCCRTRNDGAALPNADAAEIAERTTIDRIIIVSGTVVSGRCQRAVLSVLRISDESYSERAGESC